MRSKARRRNLVRRKTRLGLPDLDHAKAAVLASRRSPDSQRSYRHAIGEFVGWYCSEPRLSFNKTVVTRYLFHLEDRKLAPGTTNVRLAAVRRLAYEAADSGLLSPKLAAGIRRVKGAKKLGVRLGNWLTTEQARALCQLPYAETLKGKRDRAMLAVLVGCGLRRRELCELTFDHLQRREEHWAFVDLVGKAVHVRTIPVPDWVKRTIDNWLTPASVTSGRLFRRVLPRWQSLGRRYHRKSGLACRQGIRGKDWRAEACTTLPIAAGATLAAWSPPLAIAAGGLTVFAAAYYKKGWSWWIVGLVTLLVGLILQWNEIDQKNEKK